MWKINLIYWQLQYISIERIKNKRLNNTFLPLFPTFSFTSDSKLFYSPHPQGAQEKWGGAMVHVKVLISAIPPSHVVYLLQCGIFMRCSPSRKSLLQCGSPMGCRGLCPSASSTFFPFSFPGLDLCRAVFPFARLVFLALQKSALLEVQQS